MGMYTTVSYEVFLRNLTPEEVVWFDTQFGGALGKCMFTPSHPFFSVGRANFLTHGVLSYVDEDELEGYEGEFTKHETGWLLRAEASVKNYQGEVDVFVDWLDSRVWDGKFKSKYEECDEWTHIAWKEGKRA